MQVLVFAALMALTMTGCAASTGVVPIGPDTYALSEMRAPVRGGGPEAWRVLLAEAAEFCQRQGRVFSLLDLRPNSDPYSRYYPVAFSAMFQCLVPTSVGRQAALLGS